MKEFRRRDIRIGFGKGNSEPVQTRKPTIQVCGNALFTLAAISSLLRVIVAVFLVYSHLLGFTAPAEWIQRWIPKMSRYSIDLVAVLAPTLLLFMCFWDCVTMWGAAHMRRLDSYRISLAATLPASVPFFSPCLILGLPFAWVAYRILHDPSSPQHFAR